MQFTRVLAAVTASAALVLAPSAAWADSNAHTDPAGDVVSLKAPTTPTAEPEQVKGDVTTIRVSHLKRSVRVKVHFRELSRSGDGFGHFFALRSNTALRYVDVEGGPGMWRGERTLFNAKGNEISCRGVSHQIDYVANTVLVVVPRACLGNPRWVRVAQYSIVAENGKVYADDARTTGYVEGIFYGPRIRR